MSRAPNENGGPVAEAAANMNRARAKPDALAELSIWLRSQWLRRYALYSSLGGESDRIAMVMLAACIDLVKGVQK